MDHADLALREYRDFFLGRPDDVCADGRAFEEADGFEHVDARGAIGVLGILHFERRLRKVDADRHPVLHRRRAGRRKLFRIERVVGVRPENRRDAIVLSEPALDELVALLDGVAGVLGIGAALIDHRGGDHGTHAAAVDDLGDRIRVVVHVDEGGGAAANHLPARELGADAYELGVDKLDLGREDVVVQPVHQREVVGNAAQQGHGSV